MKKLPLNGAARFLATGARVWNQFMMFIVVVGALPMIFPQWVRPEDKILVLAIVGLLFLVSFISEIWRRFLESQKKSVKFLTNFQLLSRTILLTLFLHLFGRINGPFFVLYLLVIMESFLSGNPALSNLILGFLILATSFEFSWLVFINEIRPDYDVLIGFLIRIISLVFMHAYGAVLREKIIAEIRAKSEVKKTKEKVNGLSSKLKKANVRLQELSSLKDEFVSVASHELRAPMTMIKGYLSMVLEGDAGKIPPKVKEFLKNAYEGNDRMIRLVNNMLNVSRIESGRMVVNLEDIRLEEAIEEVVRDYQIEARNHGLELKFFKPGKKLPKVRVDADRIKEVIANLIGNAINFTPRGHVHVRVYEERGIVTTTVADTGVGIAKKDQAELFKKFSQVNAGTPLKKGSGLGLYISKMLVNEFGGDIWLKSRLRKGTTFYFSLPGIDKSARKEK